MRLRSSPWVLAVLLLAGLCLVVVALWVYGRLTSPTPAQVAALEANPVAFAQALAPLARDLDEAERVLRAPRFVDPRPAVAIDDAGPSFDAVAARCSATRRG